MSIHTKSNKEGGIKGENVVNSIKDKKGGCQQDESLSKVSTLDIISSKYSLSLINISFINFPCLNNQIILIHCISQLARTQFLLITQSSTQKIIKYIAVVSQTHLIVKLESQLSSTLLMKNLYKIMTEDQQHSIKLSTNAHHENNTVIQQSTQYELAPSPSNKQQMIKCHEFNELKQLKYKLSLLEHQILKCKQAFKQTQSQK